MQSQLQRLVAPGKIWVKQSKRKGNFFRKKKTKNKKQKKGEFSITLFCKNVFLNKVTCVQ
jgi:hypothetical protein